MTIAIWFISALQASSLPIDLASSRVVQNNAAPGATKYQGLILGATKLRNDGRIKEAATLFERVAQLAERDREPSIESRALLGSAGCYIRLFRYREALSKSGRAFQLAKQVNEYAGAGAAAGNEATIYYQLGDYPSANEAADRAVSLLDHSPRKDYLAQALCMAGDVKSKLNEVEQSKALFRRAITVAHTANLPLNEGIAQDHLGNTLLESGDTSAAERSLLSAQGLFRESKNEDYLAVANEDLADLYLRKKDFSACLALIDKVLQSHARTFIPTYWPLQTKGRALLAMGKLNEAVIVFNAAVASADRWRTGILLGDATGTRTAVSLFSVYEDYAESAANAAISNHDVSLSYKAFEVLTSGRAWDLRDQLLSVLKRDMRLPPRYYQLLSDLQDAQAFVTLDGNPEELQSRTLRLQRIRLELTGLENKLGLQFSTLALASDESPSHRVSLLRIQAALNESELLLSFYLGQNRSFLWAVIKDHCDLYELPPSHRVAQLAHAFSEMVQSEKVQQGYTANVRAIEFSKSLFAQLPARMYSKREWLISANGELLDGIPFSALPDPENESRTLIESRTLRFLPSAALLLSPAVSELHNAFVGIADPIYNSADSRRRPPMAPVSPIPPRSSWWVSLGRLVGSYEEIRMAASSSKLSNVQFLIGAKASVKDLRNTFDKAAPAIVHFAVHVVAPNNANGAQAALALSATNSGMPELLTKEMIATLRVPGSLVVLSGCASQQGEILPSAGMIGLSRAWLLAGAAAVLVTGWAVPDDSGAFFQTFYTNFRLEKGSVSKRAAVSLQKTQLTEMHSKTESEPSFWAAYSLICKN
jgi:tetratricopeptide (TPR) repeat protein